MNKPTCDTCPYWLRSDILRWENTGTCRRHPPSIPEDPQDPGCVSWPRTNHSDFCGEHPDFPAYLAEKKGVKP